MHLPETISKNVSMGDTSADCPFTTPFGCVTGLSNVRTSWYVLYCHVILRAYHSAGCLKYLFFGLALSTVGPIIPDLCLSQRRLRSVAIRTARTRLLVVCGSSGCFQCQYVLYGSVQAPTIEWLPNECFASACRTSTGHRQSCDKQERVQTVIAESALFSQGISANIAQDFW